MARTTYHREKHRDNDITNSRFVKYRYRRQITPLPYTYATAYEEKSTMETSSDHSDEAGSCQDGFEEYSYILSWRPQSIGIAPTIGRPATPDLGGGSDRDSLSSQRSRNNMQAGLTRRRERTTTWVAGVTDELQTEDPALRGSLRQLAQPGSLKRMAAVRRKNTKVVMALAPVDSARTGTEPHVGYVAACGSIQPRPMYRNVSFDAAEEVLTLAPSQSTTTNARFPRSGADSPDSLPTGNEYDAGSSDVGDTAYASRQWESCPYEQDEGCTKVEKHNGQSAGVDQGRPRIARTFSEMGIATVVPTALIK
ncbi:hypothetical protein T440DRAFT_35844 [Plenodomus tracheiphilus IPT5]|uniref:Uncharacterized protein n=1 Tax=Plenodomus tracheiphilus IPT5 TaxID=1408161 RepID=A0A6A7B9H6_9PLEO|nr:hypothetical protein T440DRAFT_35844 [Plenodomus tracheiphilus IPT5]